MEADRTLTTHAGAGCYEAITPTNNTYKYILVYFFKTKTENRVCFQFTFTCLSEVYKAKGYKSIHGFNCQIHRKVKVHVVHGTVAVHNKY